MSQLTSLFKMCIIIVLIYLIYQFFNPTKESFVARFINYGRPSKCFDCEKQFPVKKRWKGNASKCFDCERELDHNNINPYHNGPSKCFSCERQSKRL